MNPGQQAYKLKLEQNRTKTLEHITGLVDLIMTGSINALSDSDGFRYLGESVYSVPPALYDDLEQAHLLEANIENMDSTE